MQLGVTVGTIPGIRTLPPSECHRVLRDVGWGVLATVDVTGTPYGVPVGYGFDGERLFLGLGPGRKMANLAENPRVSLTVTNIKSFDHWTSVVVTGTAVRLESPIERYAAVRALHNQRRMLQAPHIVDARRLLRAAFYMVTIDELSGRARDWQSDA